MSDERGNVKWFSSEKGYGFIERDGAEDVFVHHSQISMDGFRTLDAGEPVEFDIIKGDRGPKAQNVFRADAQSAGESVSANGNGRRTNGNASNGRNRTAATSGSTAPGFVGQIRQKLFGRLTRHA